MPKKRQQDWADPLPSNEPLWWDTVARRSFEFISANKLYLLIALAIVFVPDGCDITMDIPWPPWGETSDAAQSNAPLLP